MCASVSAARVGAASDVLIVYCVWNGAHPCHISTALAVVDSYILNLFTIIRRVYGTSFV